MSKNIVSYRIISNFSQNCQIIRRFRYLSTKSSYVQTNLPLFEQIRYYSTFSTPFDWVKQIICQFDVLAKNQHHPTIFDRFWDHSIKSSYVRLNLSDIFWLIEFKSFISFRQLFTSFDNVKFELICQLTTTFDTFIFVNSTYFIRYFSITSDIIQKLSITKSNIFLQLSTTFDIIRQCLVEFEIIYRFLTTFDTFMFVISKKFNKKKVLQSPTYFCTQKF